MKRLGETWVPNFLKPYGASEGPSFDILMSDINTSFGNHVAPQFDAEQQKTGVYKGFWSFPKGSWKNHWNDHFPYFPTIAEAPFQALSTALVRLSRESNSARQERDLQAEMS